jgi:hypothetical protein
LIFSHFSVALGASHRRNPPRLIAAEYELIQADLPFFPIEAAKVAGA